MNECPLCGGAMERALIPQLRRRKGMKSLPVKVLGHTCTECGASVLPDHRKRRIGLVAS